MRTVSTTGFSLPFAIGGALVFDGARAGLYWIAAGDILGIVAVVLSAWVLMVEFCAEPSRIPVKVCHAETRPGFRTAITNNTMRSDSLQFATKGVVIL